MPDAPKTPWDWAMEALRVIIIGAVMGLLTWLQSQGLIAKIDQSTQDVKQRVKASENLVQETVKAEAVEVQTAVERVAEEGAKP